MKNKNANRNKMSSDRRNRVNNSKVHHHHDLGPYIVEDRRMLSRVAGDSSKWYLFDIICCYAPHKIEIAGQNLKMKPIVTWYNVIHKIWWFVEILWFDLLFLWCSWFDAVRITHIIRHGRRQTGCFTCCHAPDSCPTLAWFPCFDYPEYIVKEVNGSQ